MNRIKLDLLLPVLVLVALSLATFYSIDPGIFRSQLVFFLIGLVVYFIFLHVDYRIFAYYSVPIYILSIILLGILFVIGIEARGSVRWIELFGIRVQFSEVLKPLFIIGFASFISYSPSRSFSKLILLLILCFPIFFLVLRQPDLGNAMVYFFILTFMLLLAQFPLWQFGVLGSLAALPMPFLFHMLHDYQKQRIYSFLDTTSDPYGISYNAVQSMISVGSGGWMGKGFGHGTQSILNFLPERHTDFIFATLSESLGFLGGSVLLFCYIFLLYRVYKIGTQIDEPLPYLVLMGCYVFFLTQLFINIGMNIGIVPIVGITLPFVSYGGSSLLANFLTLGIISFITNEYDNRKTYEIN